eukprot:Tbor_TRINITY_DN5873_c0_g1::TRINITY_DN5873_c0_g1_i1::g.7133::m.7133/K20472/COPZ, RET3; coatomer subunit zeta
MEYLHKVEAIVILDNFGRRIFAKYFAAEVPNEASTSALPSSNTWTLKSQLMLESSLHMKVRGNDNHAGFANGNCDIIIERDSTVLYNVAPELTIFVIGGKDENEIVLSTVLTCLVESLQELTKSNGIIDKRTLLDNYDTLLMIVDEMIDDGLVFECSATAVVSEVAPFVMETSGADGAKKALDTLGKFIKQQA